MRIRFLFVTKGFAAESFASVTPQTLSRLTIRDQVSPDTTV